MFDEKERVRKKLLNFCKALSRLEEALKIETEEDIIVDAVIQRFEFVYELSWKLLKAFLEYKGITSSDYPREIFRIAFNYGLIKNNEKWESMIKDRNLTSHIYDESIAFEVFERVKSDYLKLFEDLKDRIVKEVNI
ncbi:MAG: nucleotidyltransferase substrate binding protein [Brevinematia bacterium]